MAVRAATAAAAPAFTPSQLSAGYTLRAAAPARAAAARVEEREEKTQSRSAPATALAAPKPRAAELLGAVNAAATAEAALTSTSAAAFWSEEYNVLNLYPTAVPGKAAPITGPQCVQKFAKVMGLARDAVRALQSGEYHKFDGTVGDAACQIRAALVLDVALATAGAHPGCGPQGLAAAYDVVNGLYELAAALQHTPAAQRKTFNLSDALQGVPSVVPASVAACIMSYTLAVGSIKKPWSPLLSPNASTVQADAPPPFPAYLTVSDWLPLQQATGPELYGRHFYKNLMLGCKFNLSALSTRYVQAEADALLHAAKTAPLPVNGTAAGAAAASVHELAEVTALAEGVSNAFVRSNHMGMACVPCFSTFAVLDARAAQKHTRFALNVSRLHVDTRTEYEQHTVLTSHTHFGLNGDAAPGRGRMVLDCSSTAPRDAVASPALMDRIRALGPAPFMLGMSAVHPQFPDSFKYTYTPGVSVAAAAPAPNGDAAAAAPGRPLAPPATAVEECFPPALRDLWARHRDAALRDGMCESNQSLCHVYHVRAE